MAYEKLVVYCTARDYEEGRAIALALVKENLAACVNIVPNMTSIYHWKGKIEEEKEVLLIIKTSHELFNTLMGWIKELHSYEVPEVIAFKPVEISPDFEAWWDGEIKSPADLGT